MGCPRFPGFYQQHIANSYNKKTLQEVWEKEREILHNTCLNKFRTTVDVNQWLFKEWQIASGNFKPRSIKFGKSFYIDRDGIDKVNKKVTNYIKKQKGKIISINDGKMTEEDFLKIVADLEKSFNTTLSEKSSFEK